jgi:hypothetical protein
VSFWAGPNWSGLLPRSVNVFQPGVIADVFVVGGAAMALAHDVKRVTHDADARFMPHGIVLERRKDDPGKRRVFDHPGLRAMAASPEHVFAMKALAALTFVQDGWAVALASSCA